MKSNLKFPTDDEYLEFVTELDKCKLRLTSGNCGIFAYALKEVFQTGELFNTGGFCHILLEHDGKYYDGEGIYNSFEELQDSHWGNYIRDLNDYDDLVNCDNNEAYDRILEGTCHTLGKEFFIELIKKEFKLTHQTKL